MWQKQTQSDVFEYSPHGYYRLNNEESISQVNGPGALLLGYEREVLLNRTFSDFIMAEDRPIFRTSWSKLMETWDHQVCEVRMARSDGQRLWLQLDLSVAETGDEPGILISLTDVTLQRQIENIQAFLQGYRRTGSNNKFFDALAAYLARALNMDYVCIDRIAEGSLEAQTVAVYFDGQYEDNMKYKLEDTPCGQAVSQSFCCFPSNVRTLFPKDVVLQEMGAESYSGITLWGSNGRPIGLIAVIGRKPLVDTRWTETVLKQVSILTAFELEHRQMEEDIIQSRNALEHLVRARTEELQNAIVQLRNEIKIRRQKEKSLTVAEQKYRTVADFTYDWETWISPEGRFLYVSPSCQAITGYTVEEFCQNPSLVIQITHPEDREFVQTHYHDKLKRSVGACSIDYRIITRNGEERWIGHSCQPVYDVKGKWIGQRGSNRDITERKVSERFLIDSRNQLQALTRRIEDLAEEERTRIAREIHDELGHLLTSLKFDIESIGNKSDGSHDQLHQELASVTSAVDNLIHAVRKIATELRPGILDHLGLIPALEWQLEQFRRRTSICCEYDLSDIKEVFNGKETTVIYRIFQEILTNIVRHASADKITVSAERKNGYFKFITTDNGTGFEESSISSPGSLGLMGMRERALSIGGEIDIESGLGKGTRVTLLLRREQAGIA